MLSVMDGYSGYKQIKLSEKDQEKTTFITKVGLYRYNVMLLGLMNNEAMY